VSENEKLSAESGDAGEEHADEQELIDDGPDLSPEESLKAELDQALSDVASAKEDVLRARAEADNVRKRAERDVVAAHKFGLERFIGELLPVKDSMDLGFDALDAAADIDAIREGMALTRKMLEDALDKTGLTVIDPIGEAFDPDFHQAMTMQPSSEAAPGTVLSVMQKGYVLNDRLIRPAMVIVAKAVADGEQ
jgi:molecular chaperone GrpE